MPRTTIRWRIVPLLAACSVLWGTATAGATHVPQELAEAGYSLAVLERLPAEDIAEIVRTLPPPSCAPTAATNPC